MTMAPDGSEKYDGKWHTHYFCAKCDHRVTWDQKMNLACCPYCGHGVVGTVMNTTIRSMRWEPVERKWWQIWRVFSGTFVETPNRVTGKKEWAGVTSHPAPNRRAAIAHTRAKS